MKQTRTPGRTVVGSRVNSTPFFLRSAASVDAADRETEVIEAAIGYARRRIGAVAVRHRSDEDIGAAKLEIDARLAVLRAAQNLGAEHFLEPLRHGLRIGGAQMNVVPRIGRHLVRSPHFACVNAS